MEENTIIETAAEEVVKEKTMPKGAVIGILGLAATGIAALGYGSFKGCKKLVAKIKDKKAAKEAGKDLPDIEVEGTEVE